MQFSREYPLKNGETVLVRHAEMEDVPRVTFVSNAVIRETCYLSRTPDDPPDTEDDSSSYISDCLCAAREAFLVAEYQGETVGFAHLDGCGLRKKFLHRCSVALCVLERYANRGIGRALMLALIQLAREANYEQIELNVIEQNENATHLYRPLGFEVCGREPRAMKFAEGQYGDYLFMMKVL